MGRRWLPTLVLLIVAAVADCQYFDLLQGLQQIFQPYQQPDYIPPFNTPGPNRQKQANRHENKAKTQAQRNQDGRRTTAIYNQYDYTFATTQKPRKPSKSNSSQTQNNSRNNKNQYSSVLGDYFNTNFEITTKSSKNNKAKTTTTTEVNYFNNNNGFNNNNRQTTENIFSNSNSNNRNENYNVDRPVTENVFKNNYNDNYAVSNYNPSNFNNNRRTDNLNNNANNYYGSLTSTPNNRDYYQNNFNNNNQQNSNRNNNRENFNNQRNPNVQSTTYSQNNRPNNNNRGNNYNNKNPGNYGTTNAGFVNSNTGTNYNRRPESNSNGNFNRGTNFDSSRGTYNNYDTNTGSNSYSNSWGTSNNGGNRGTTNNYDNYNRGNSNNDYNNRETSNQYNRGTTNYNSNNRGNDNSNNRGNGNSNKNNNVNWGNTDYDPVREYPSYFPTGNPQINQPGVRPAPVDVDQPPITNKPQTAGHNFVVFPRPTDPGYITFTEGPDTEPDILIGPDEDDLTEGEKRRYVNYLEKMCDRYKALSIKKVVALPLVPSPDPVEVNVSTCTPINVPLIIGGKVVSIRDFPHMALVGWMKTRQAGYSWNCGGSLISDQYVLTAGHCTYQDKDYDVVSGPPHAVQLGSSYLDDPGALVVKVTAVIRHPKYKQSRRYHDIAMIKLVNKVTFSEVIRPACIGVPPPAGSHIIATGWGRTEFGGDHSLELRSVSLPVWDINECRKVYEPSRKLPSGPTPESHTCAGDPKGGKDTCQGDSGGPAQVSDGCAWRVVGVTSLGRSCGAPRTPALYANIPRVFIALQLYTDT